MHSLLGTVVVYAALIHPRFGQPPFIGLIQAVQHYTGEIKENRIQNWIRRAGPTQIVAYAGFCELSAGSNGWRASRSDQC